MKKLLIMGLVILFPMILLAKQVCIAPSGCSIDMDTGLCPNCIEVEEPPIIKEEKVIVEKKPEVKVSKPPLYPRVNESLGKTKPTKPKSWKGTLFKCVVGCRYAWWDSEGNDYDKDGNLVLNTVPKITSTNTKKPYWNEKGVEMCWFPELGWVKGLDSSGQPIPTGEYRDCNWRNRGNMTADAIKRGIKECGGYMNWVWTDEHHSKYSCNSRPKVSYTGCTWKCVVEPCSDDMLPDGCRWVGRN